MQHHKVTCDNCGADLTSTGNSVDYRLALASEKLPLHAGAMSCTDTMIFPPITHDAHFCGMVCLKKWVDSETAPKGKIDSWGRAY